jgi:hypothetical protein
MLSFRAQRRTYGLGWSAGASCELHRSFGLQRTRPQVGFATAHTFLLMNGFDLDIRSKAAFSFMIKTLAEGKSRFAVLHEWIARHLAPLSG